MVFIRRSLDGTYYCMGLSVHLSVWLLVRKNGDGISKLSVQVYLGVPLIDLWFVWSSLIKYAHNCLISEFSIFGIDGVIF